MRATTLNEEIGLKDQKNEIKASTAFQGAKPKKGSAPQAKQSQKGKNTDKTTQPFKTKGSQTSAAGPFLPTDKPILPNTRKHKLEEGPV